MGLFKTDKRCLYQQNYVNIPSWHSKGYLGEGLTLLHDDLGQTSHNDVCVDMMQTILPLAKIYSGELVHTKVKGRLRNAI